MIQTAKKKSPYTGFIFPPVAQAVLIYNSYTKVYGQKEQHYHSFSAPIFSNEFPNNFVNANIALVT